MVGELATSPTVERLRLAPLSAAAVAQLVDDEPSEVVTAPAQAEPDFGRQWRRRESKARTGSVVDSPARRLDVDRVHARLETLVADARMPRPIADDYILKPLNGNAAPLATRR